MHPDTDRRGLLALLAAVLIWGSTFVLTKGLLDQIGPFTLAVARFVIALAVLVPLARRHGFRPRLVLTRRYLLFGASGVTAYFGLQNLALVFTTAGSAALISALIPAMTAVWAAVVLKERPTRVQLAGIVLSVIGVSLVVRSGLALGDVRALAGNLMMLGTTWVWAVYTVEGRKLAADTPALVLSTASIAAGTLLLLPLAAVELLVQGPKDLQWSGVAGIAYLGVGASALTFWLWNWALRHVRAPAAAAAVNLVPVVGLAFAVTAGEAVTPLQLLGGGIAVVAVALAQGPSTPEPVPQPAPADDSPRADAVP